MGKIGMGYGSEWHLLRYLGRHRQLLNCEIGKEMGGRVIEWVDFGFDPNDKYRIFDAELQGIEFLPRDPVILKKWHEFWPQRGNAQNWDAVGRIEIHGKSQWLLVEAKSHIDEINSSCGAKESGGRRQIKETLNKVKSDLHVVDDKDWLDPYYQYCNRIAVQHFLSSHNIFASLLFIYFFGDKFQNNNGRICPENQRDWEDPLIKMYEHIGLSWRQQKKLGIFKIFLPVHGESGGQ